VCSVLTEAANKHPDKRVFVLPESTFPFPLENNSYALKMWTDNALKEDKVLVIGGYRSEEQKLFNTMYIVKNNRIIFYYDKTHLVPFFEEKKNLPKLFKKGNSLFLSKRNSFIRSKNPCRTCFLEDISFKPLICSEVFWKLPKKGNQFLVLANDFYFSFSYFPRVMKRLAQMNTYKQASNLVYCSYWCNYKKEI
jgi:apolipoprotein N-acyltransferase